MKRLIFVFMLLLVGASAAIAQRAISGKVTDEKGEALIGASILAKGSAVGTVSDLDGVFSLQVPVGTSMLLVSYTGYLTKEVALTNANAYEIVLASDVIAMSEVVGVGYGTQQKRDVTGSISQVKGDAIANLATPSFESQLAGRAAGVQITPPSGILGAPPQIRIRGVNSISSGTGPLIVLDGVPVLSGNAGGFTPANTLGDINPADIESFEILKDGAATAIYGSRASNGVILITKKRR
jgi:TonB-dependent starch-binding outer membrane protein SusC